MFARDKKHEVVKLAIYVFFLNWLDVFFYDVLCGLQVLDADVPL